MRPSALLLVFFTLTPMTAYAEPAPPAEGSAPAASAPTRPKKGGPNKKKGTKGVSAPPKPAAVEPPPPAPPPVETPPPPHDGVERIDLGPAPTDALAPPVAPAPPPVADPDTFQIRGWSRVRASVQAGYGADVVPNDPVYLQVPNNAVTSDAQLFLRLRYAHGRSFEAVVSGFLGYTLTDHDAYSPAVGAMHRSAQGFYEGDLREAYVGFFWNKVDLRIGQQRIAWGNSDAFTPNDVLNPRDLRDPVLEETDTQRIPTLAVRGDAALPFGDLQLVFEPFFTPDRVDAYGTDWAFIQPSAPAALRGVFSQVYSSISPSLQGVLQPLLRQTALPADNLQGAQAGARYSWTAGGVDVAHYYQYGYAYAPALTIAPALLASLAATDWSTPSTTALNSLVAGVNSGQLQSTYQRRQHVGTSAQIAVSPFLLRLDAAYDTANVYSDTNLLGVVRPTIQAVLGAEYQTGEVGKNIFVEGWYSHLFGGALATPLLGSDIDNIAVSTVARWTFAEHLELELRAIGGVRPVGVSARPQIAYKTDGWELRGGYVWLTGEDDSSQRYYRRNSSGYLVLRRFF